MTAATSVMEAERPAAAAPNSRDLLLATKTFAQDQPRRSWWCLWSTLAIFITLIVLICLVPPWWLRLPLSVVAGLVMVRLFVLYHDYQHRAILRGSRLAGWIMTAWGLLTLNPPSIWNRSHDHHHRNNARIFGASIGSFPVMTVHEYAHAPRSERLRYAISRHPLTIALGYLTVFLYGMCIRSLMANPRAHRDSAAALAIHLTIVVGLAIAAPAALVFAFLLPSTVAAALGAYLFYAQHNFPGVQLRSRAEWNYVDAALEASSYMKTSRLMAWFTGNIGYHHIHHLNARIPFYRLPEAMAALPEVQSPKTTTLRPRDVVRCLRLKLWDPTSEQFVPFAAAKNHNNPHPF